MMHGTTNIKPYIHISFPP